MKFMRLLSNDTEEEQTEEVKKEILEKYANGDNSDDEDAKFNMSESDIILEQKTNSSTYSVVNKTAVLASPVKSKLVNYDSPTKPSVGDFSMIDVNIDENHFGLTPVEDVSNIKAEIEAEEEEKVPMDEVENEDFDNLINKPDNQSMAPRPDRLSTLVQGLTTDDFEMIRFLGDGSYGKVNLVRCKINGMEYALKILDKRRVAKFDKIENVMREKDIMFLLDHPNIARLEMTFHDDQSLFFLMEYAPNGDLAGLIKKEKKLSLKLIRFYACEIINALECLRGFKVVHRDLKPENILLDANCHIKLTDFGDSKVIDIEKAHSKIMRESFVPEVPKVDATGIDQEFESNFGFEGEGDGRREDRGESFVGTPLYVSPEMLNHNIAAYATDLWALGCILYQCACGVPPFLGFTEQQIYDKISNRKIYYPEDLDPLLKDLIDKLLQLNPKDRLGAGIGDEDENGIDALKAHKFFAGMDFATVHQKEVPISETLRATLEMLKKAKDVPMKVNDLDSDDDPDKPGLIKSNSAKTEPTYTSKKPDVEHQYSTKATMNEKSINKISMSQERSSETVKKGTDDALKESMVEKRNKWYFFQDRTLKLTKDLRLMYYKNQAYRSDIALNKTTSVRKEKPHHFEVITPNKIFHFRCKEGDSATEWVKYIKAAIKAAVERDKAVKKK